MNVGFNKLSSLPTPNDMENVLSLMERLMDSLMESYGKTRVLLYFQVGKCVLAVMEGQVNGVDPMNMELNTCSRRQA